MTHAIEKLPDVQGYADTRGVAIEKVGVKNVELPLSIIQRDGHTQMVAAHVTMSVNLPPEEKGTHLSRFIIQLSDHSRSKAFCYNLKQFLTDTQQRLNAGYAHIQIDFSYFIEKKSPVSNYAAPMAHSCRFEAALTPEGQYQFVLGLETPIATLCPCSKAISDYGAHNQRALIKTLLRLDTQAEHEVLWLEDLVNLLDECASCPVYPILKRADEKYVTERAYDNPKFVEDVVREATLALRKTPGVQGFSVEVEALESIHGHNAWAYQSEGASASL